MQLQISNVPGANGSILAGLQALQKSPSGGNGQLQIPGGMGRGKRMTAADKRKAKQQAQMQGVKSNLMATSRGGATARSNVSAMNSSRAPQQRKEASP